MGKQQYTIIEISKKEAKPILDEHHYLSGISKGFKSGCNYGLIFCGEIVGVIIFTGFPVPELSKGMLGLSRENQEGLYELSRLCLRPDVQKSEHNLASWFVARAIKKLRKQNKVRAILSYADSGFHEGTIYRACNFKYYGLTATKKDFWIKQEDGSFLKHSRGKVRGLEGEWRPRNRKHRFLLIYDKYLKVRWEEKIYN